MVSIWTSDGLSSPTFDESMMTTAEYAITIGNLFAAGIIGMPLTAPLVSALLRRWTYPLSFTIIFWRAMFGAG
jgi:hypothetical protein